MFQYFNNILAVEIGVLCETGILSMPNLKLLRHRGKVNQLRRACKGVSGLLEYASLPERFRTVIEERFGDPRLTTKHNRFIDQLELDTKANEFFNAYTLDNGYPLPEKAKAEYISNAVVLNAIQEVINNRSARVHSLGGKISKIWDNLALIVSELPRHTYPHSLPLNVRRLKDKYFAYKKDGYQSLVHKGYCNKNSEKINDAAKPWLLARWADRVNRCATYKQLFGEYNKLAVENGWKKLTNPDTLKTYLNQEQLVHLWHGNRFGEKKSKEKFTLHISTKMPSMRDSLWYSDGTKLNLFYQDAEGKISTCQVYEVMDAFSEVFLGFHISQTENYEAQYGAYKMAVQVAGHRPYEIRYDNQGGHKKLETGNFLKTLAHLSIKAQPYNGKSKSIESAFGRFQQQYLKQYWFFTGQNITAKKDESKANLEFIQANKASLPTLNQVIEIYKEARMKWNNDTHPVYKEPRWEVYQQSENPKAPEINLFEMVDLFWIQRPHPVQYSAYGLTFKEKGVPYSYLVYSAPNEPDYNWHVVNIDKKFVVKFDPDDMTMIYLYEQTATGLRFVTEAHTKIEVHRNQQEQEEWEAKWIQGAIQKNKELRVASQDQIDTIQEMYGMLPEQNGLVSPKLAGVKSPQKVKAKKARRHLEDINKTISNLVLIDDNIDKIDIYKMM
jgi:hypothetical protein